MKRFILILFLICSFASHAKLYIQTSAGYHTDEDDVNDFTYSTTMLNFFIGGSFGKGEKWVVGQNFVQSARTEYDTSESQENELSLLELGPRIQYFFTVMKTAYVAVVYNLYANGTRTLSGNEQDVEGTSTIFSFGYQLKMSRSSYLGFSINYHSISLSKQTESNTATDISQSYTLMYPAIDLSFRF